MEPRPLGRGMAGLVAVDGGRDMGFNGATTSRSWNASSSASTGFTTLWLQWSHDLSVVECTSWPRGERGASGRFNGATTSRSWNAESLEIGLHSLALLQWSHDLSVVECWSLSALRRLRRPLQWSHDLSVVECSCDGR